MKRTMSLRKILKEIFSKKYLIEINIDTKQWERKNKTKPESVGVQSWRISDEIDNEFNVFGDWRSVIQQLKNFARKNNINNFTLL